MTTPPKSIYNFPTINSKLYVPTDPALVQSATCSNSLSFEPYVTEVSRRKLGISDELMKPINNTPKNEKEPCLSRGLMKEAHEAVMGKYLPRHENSGLESGCGQIKRHRNHPSRNPLLLASNAVKHRYVQRIVGITKPIEDGFYLDRCFMVRCPP